MSEVNRDKPCLAFVPGWGQSSKVWFSQIPRFSPGYSVRAINFPGHAGLPEAPAGQWPDRLLQQCPNRPVIMIGWSLGGMLALQLALRYRSRISGLVLVSATPCFCKKEGWEHGCEDAVFEEFKQGVAMHSIKIMSRFFALMFHGDALPRPAYNRLARAVVNRKHPPTRKALETGLEILSNLDLREDLDNIHLPCLVLHGENDTVVPLAAGQALAAGIPDACFLGFPDCGHAPFLTQADRFNHILEDWCRNPESINNT